VAYELLNSPGLVQARHIIFANGRMVAQYTTRSNGQNDMRYFALDNLGSVSLVTNETGQIVERLSYDAFGKRRFASGADDATNSLAAITTSYSFTGHEYLDDLKLIHMNGRLYDPFIGRFTSADPHMPGLDNPQGLNLFGYVMNGPLTRTDPTGFDLVNILDFLGGSGGTPLPLGNWDICFNPCKVNDVSSPGDSQETDGGSEGPAVPMETITVTPEPPSAPVVPMETITVTAETPGWFSSGFNLSINFGWAFIPGGGVLHSSGIVINPGANGACPGFSLITSDGVGGGLNLGGGFTLGIARGPLSNALGNSNQFDGGIGPLIFGYSVNPGTIGRADGFYIGRGVGIPVPQASGSYVNTVPAQPNPMLPGLGKPIYTSDQGDDTCEKRSRRRG
jgi:RHS repeat-associated protein